jgi:CelD/BcsL family acetyltransferase involved in cellulose biosynthesis
MNVASGIAGLTHSVPPSGSFALSASRRNRMVTSVIDDADAFDTLRDEWDDLLDNSDQRVFFLRCRWNAMWWQHYAPPGARLHLITCRTEDGTLVGLAPFYWRQHRLCGLPYARELLFVGMGITLKTSEHLDIIARRGEERAVGEAVALALTRTRQWDRLWLWQIPRESLVLPHFIRALGIDIQTRVCDEAPYIDTSTDWATFKAGFGRSMRRNVEYYPRRLFRTHPDCEFRRVRFADQLEPAMDALVQLHQMRWRAKGEPGAFEHPVFEAFLRGVARQAFVAGRLALWTLTIEGRIEAALIGFVDNGVVHYFQKGFNPSFEKEDLGTAMLALCVRDCFDDPEVRAFDFMGGGAPYKSLWARAARENVVCEGQRRTLGSAIYQWKGRATNVAAAVYRRLTPEWLRILRRDRLRKLRFGSKSARVVPLLTLWLTDAEAVTSGIVGLIISAL